MELRRALLLFAIVLGLAALVASASRPPASDTTDTAPPGTTSTATAGPSPGPGPPEAIALEADLKPETRTIDAGRAATLTVTAYEPGQVEIGKLGLSAPVEPGGPAIFDLLVESPQTFRVTFTPFEPGKTRRIGVIEVDKGP